MRGGWRWFGGGPMGDAAARCVDEVFLCSFLYYFVLLALFIAVAICWMDLVFR
jgi:hypothetical protein